MKTLKTFGLELILAATLCLSGCDDMKMYVDQNAFENEQKQLMQTLHKKSPYSQIPVTVVIKNNRTQKTWYSKHSFVPVSDSQIIYEKEGSLFFGQIKNESESKKICKHNGINANKIYRVKNENKNDIFWIDKEYNIRKVEIDKEKVTDFGVIDNLRNYFKKIPKEIAIDDVTCDGQPDIIYVGKEKIHKRVKNAIKMLEGEKNGKFRNFGPVFYLGNENIDAFVLEDVDKDGDPDLLYKPHSNKAILLLENRIKKGDLKDKIVVTEKMSRYATPEERASRGASARYSVNSSDDTFFYYWYWYGCVLDENTPSTYSQGSSYSSSRSRSSIEEDEGENTTEKQDNESQEVSEETELNENVESESETEMENSSSDFDVNSDADGVESDVGGSDFGGGDAGDGGGDSGGDAGGGDGGGGGGD